MIFSVIDEHNEQQLINVLHVVRVSCSKGVNRACIHLANGQWIKTIHSIGEVQTQIDSIFKRTCEWLRFMSLQSYEVDDKAIDLSNTVRQESLRLNFDGVEVRDEEYDDMTKIKEKLKHAVDSGNVSSAVSSRIVDELLQPAAPVNAWK